jgi:hypothetical protein
VRAQAGSSSPQGLIVPTARTNLSGGSPSASLASLSLAKTL